MISSYHMSSSNTDSEMSVSVGTLMTRSLDPSLLDGHEAVVDQENCPGESTTLKYTLFGHTSAETETCLSTESASSAAPLQAATKLVPVPESLMSPDYRPATAPAPMPPKSPKARVPTRSGSLKEGRRHPVPRRGPSAPGHSSDEDSEMSASKLETIRHRAQERWHQKDGVPAFADKCEMWTNATPPSASEMPAPETVDPGNLPLTLLPFSVLFDKSITFLHFTISSVELNCWNSLFVFYNDLSLFQKCLNIIIMAKLNPAWINVSVCLGWIWVHFKS